MNRNNLKILLIEDNPSDVFFLKRVLDKSNMSYTIHVVDSKNEYLGSLNHFIPDIVLSDHTLPTFNSLEAFRMARDIYPDIPFILVTGSVSEEFAVECMKAGIDDYILKSSMLRLPTAIENVFDKREMQREKEIVELLHRELKTAYREIEEKNKSITDSISYARRIQQAMLPDKKIFSAMFPESFVLFKPKDIVSGDFFWFGKCHNKLAVAVADCTGHGVPGALMSMIGYNQLNSNTSDEKVKNPAQLLFKLNEGVNHILRQDSGNNISNDGMDIAICMIDKDKKTVEFAGANRSLLFFSKGNMVIKKGDKIGVGGIKSGDSQQFNNHTFSFEKGDAIYMFTDGFADQFGGPDNRKMMTRNVLKLLSSVQLCDMNQQQKMVERAFRDWKGDNEQTDDMLMMGIRF